MDFIFMLTRGDKTILDGIEVIDTIAKCGVTHIGFKDVGVDKQTLISLTDRIREIGATSYIEVVSTTSEDIYNSLAVAAELGVDRVLGGQDVGQALDILKDCGAEYYPFPGKPAGHPTKLGGTPDDIARDCENMMATGCAGVDLLAYRATDCDPLDLVRAAKGSMNGGYLIVAGSVDSPERIRALAGAGADAFTIGTAVFDGSFSPNKGAIQSQCRDVLAACEG
ncbi:MAG: hypothetical protein HOC63_12040 [Rhodospirillales bacterium]|jgi:uncharacterized protein related to proFAR isomerase|nr:hypothetical protein [Rhodospirillales bacterium]MBT4038565.1 hypothetical protein [Rhodospirillales bacterium]MBT4627408.1 hypothetical protein [Rhodospirillales bacterium]MBT5351461.1 hypothetical protein [Rhodospirillales bacterium]MBT5519124.1 hypothetical protein [Rhodospirillales bacterium]